MIPSREVARAINYHRRESLVVSTSAALRDWHQVSDRRDLDIDLTDCMDRAPAVGLGLSIAQPNRRILVLDCDATLRTDLASLATIGEAAPGNFVHFVLEDADPHFHRRRANSRPRQASISRAWPAAPVTLMPAASKTWKNCSSAWRTSCAGPARSWSPLKSCPDSRNHRSLSRAHDGRRLGRSSQHPQATEQR